MAPSSSMLWSGAIRCLAGFSVVFSTDFEKVQGNMFQSRISLYQLRYALLQIYDRLWAVKDDVPVSWMTESDCWNLTVPRQGLYEGEQYDVYCWAKESFRVCAVYWTPQQEWATLFNLVMTILKSSSVLNVHFFGNVKTDWTQGTWCKHLHENVGFDTKP